MSRKDLLFVAFAGLFAIGISFDLAPRVRGNQATIVDKRSQMAIEATRSVVQQIDTEFADYWASQQVAPASSADTLAICRRLSLALTGTIPSFEELRQLEQIDKADHLDWWLDHLFVDRRYSDYLAERLARVYVGVEDGPFLVFRRHRFTSWLSDSLLKNQPYNEIVRQLIADIGVWTEKPAVNFVTVTSTDGKPDEVRLAGRTARAFLGIRLDCMQCHDDNLGGGWTQADFHQLAAFFSETQHTITGIADKPRVYKTKYLGETVETAVLPSVPFDEHLLAARIDTRRERLADWVTNPKNKAFSRAIVNRTWALLVGRPLVEPVDNIPVEGPYPPGLEALAQDFVDHGFDLQHLIRSIAKSRVFGQDSRTDSERTDHLEQCWAVFPMSRLRPEQMAGGLLQSARLMTINADSHILLRLDFNDRINAFVKRYGDTGEDEFEGQAETVPQRLLMMNGDLIKERTQQDLVTNAATRIASLSPNDEQAIHVSFLAVLTRAPSATELSHFTASLGGARGYRRVRFFEDLYWVLLNSSEFSWNH